MSCQKGRWVLRYGEHVEVYSEETGDLLVSFRAVGDMCKGMLDRYLTIRHNIVVPYRLRKFK